MTSNSLVKSSRRLDQRH